MSIISTHKTYQVVDTTLPTHIVMQVEGLNRLKIPDWQKPRVTFEFKSSEKAKIAFEKLCADKNLMTYAKASIDEADKTRFTLFGHAMIGVSAISLLILAKKSMVFPFTLNKSIPLNNAPDVASSDAGEPDSEA